MSPTQKKGPVIAIDGPAGTGKSSTTRQLAELLGFVHIDTGALYRAVALLALRKKIDLSSNLDATARENLTEIAKSSHIEFKRIETLEPKNRVFVNGEDVTGFIRTEEVSLAASKASSVVGVRSALLGMQRLLGCAGKTILEGRDIGTVIFPDADVKFFLTASSHERAKRRFEELNRSGKLSQTLEEIQFQIEKRDSDDSNREIAPLKKADDAIEIDTTQLSLNQVVQKMVSIVQERVS